MDAIEFQEMKKPAFPNVNFSSRNDFSGCCKQQINVEEKKFLLPGMNYRHGK